MEEDGFAWSQARMLEHAKLFDVIRLDHFAAIVKYYVVPNKAEDGRSGKWSRGPGKKLTDAIEKVIGDTHIIVEDIAGKSPIPGVKKLMARTGWPGIKILMFAFGDDTANEHLPHNYTDCNLVVYAGTHDNETIVGYFRDKTDYELAYLYEYLNIKYKEEIPDADPSFKCKHCRCGDHTDAGSDEAWKCSADECTIHRREKLEMEDWNR